MTRINPSNGNNDVNKFSKAESSKSANVEKKEQSLLDKNECDVVNIKGKDLEPDKPLTPEEPETPGFVFGFWNSFFRGPFFRTGSDWGWGWGTPEAPGSGSLYS